MIERQYWQHVGDQKIWAVETNNRWPVRCAGPLDARDVHPLLLAHLDYSTNYLGLLLAEWRSYIPYVLCPSCGTIVRPGATTVTDGAGERVHLKCSLKPNGTGGQSAGAAVLMEDVWQVSARLHSTSVELRRRSAHLAQRCKRLRSPSRQEQLADRRPSGSSDGCAPTLAPGRV